MVQKLTIWQQNTNKSPACQHNLISNNYLSKKGISVIALQEPAINHLGNTIASRNWTPIYPTKHSEDPSGTRSVTLISSALSTDSWNQMDFPSSDVTVIQLNGSWGKLTLFNIYNDGTSNDTLRQLANFLHSNRDKIEHTEKGTAHVLWVGDFNRHHPYWDDPSDTRLFTNDALKAANRLIEVVADAGLELALPSGLPTHKHSVTKRWSRLDQVFLSDHSANILTACDTLPEERGISTDHIPILTEINLAIAQTVAAESAPNFREVNWEEFGKELSKQLAKLPPPESITGQRQLDKSCADLTRAIQATIDYKVPVTEITPKSKRWWTKELTQLRKTANKLGRQSYKRRRDSEHKVHEEHEEAAKKYRNTLDYTKQQHWRDWLERAEDPDIWTVQRLISAPATDGGGVRIPTLTYKVNDETKSANTNEEKSAALAKGFFPPKQAEGNGEARRQEPDFGQAGRITREQILRQLKRSNRTKRQDQTVY